MTATVYEKDKVVLEYYASSNSGPRITLHDYDENGEHRNKYSKWFYKDGINPFAEISKIIHPDSLIVFAELTIPDSILYSDHYICQREKEDFFKSYRDTSGLFVKEFWTVETGRIAYKNLEKYNDNGQLVYTYKKTPYNEGFDKFRYNDNGQLVEEIEVWDVETNSFQRKLHHYDGLLLVKTEFFHDTSLAFVYDYKYQDTLLTSKTTTRITDSEHFKDRRRHVEIKYEYEYF